MQALSSTSRLALATTLNGDELGLIAGHAATLAADELGLIAGNAATPAGDELGLIVSTVRCQL